MMRRVLVLAIAVFVITAGKDARGADRCLPPEGVFKRFDRTQAGTPAPDVAFLVAGQTEETLAQRMGGNGRASNSLVVNFWATWCAPCVKEMPALDRLRADVAGDGIDVLALSADREGATVVDRFYNQNGITRLETLIDPRGQVARALGVRGLPTTIMFDGQAREVARVVGEAEWDAPEVVTFLRRCLGPAA